MRAGAIPRVPLREVSDERLVALTRAGSADAFAEIARRYEPRLRAYCTGMLDPGRAEDAVQQAFLQAFVALRRPAGQEIVLRPWLYTIARNCAFDLLSRRGVVEELGPWLDRVAAPPRLLEQKEELEDLVARLRSLPRGQRRALVLRELEGRSYEEIGAVLGRTPAGIRQTIFRAREALREAAAAVLPAGLLRLLAHASAAAPAGSPLPRGLANAATAVLAAGLLAAPAAPGPVPGTIPQNDVREVTADVLPGSAEPAGDEPAPGGRSGRSRAAGAAVVGRSGQWRRSGVPGDDRADLPPAAEGLRPGPGPPAGWSPGGPPEPDSRAPGSSGPAVEPVGGLGAGAAGSDPGPFPSQEPPGSAAIDPAPGLPEPDPEPSTSAPDPEPGSADGVRRHPHGSPPGQSGRGRSRNPRAGGESRR